MDKKIKVLHFVTGGFSGATRVAADLVRSHMALPDIQPLLVLRQKKTTSADKLARLAAEDIPYRLVSGRSHIATIYQLARLCRQWQPDIVVAHGFPEHLLGRWAGWWAKVPYLVQVEHSSRERYTPWRLWQSRFLSRRSACVVGVSEGVVQSLVVQKLGASRIIAIPNGIETADYLAAEPIDLAARPHDVVMVARFAKDKDHATVVRALAYLRQQHIRCRLMFVGDGKSRHQAAIQQLAQTLGVVKCIDFAGRRSDVAELLAMHKVFVLASLREGLSLSVLEAMAAGCIVVGSRTPGICELIVDGEDGFLFQPHDAKALADILQTILQAPARFSPLAARAQAKVVRHYDKCHMSRAYADLLRSLVLN